MKGRCFCGSVRYKLTSPIKDAYYCHCRDCQYFSGSPFHVLGIVERGTIKLISGSTRIFEYQVQDNCHMKREFCENCGTPLFLTSSRFETIQMITVNSLDDPGTVTPSFEIWTKSKVPWSMIDSGIASFSHGAFDAAP